MEIIPEDQVLCIEIRQTVPDEGQSGHVAEPAERRPVTATAEQVMRLISDRNVQLLQLIKKHRPQSLAELSRLSGRPTASLTRTLQRLSALGIVVVRRTKGREKIPVVACDCLRFELPLTIAAASKP